MGIEVHDPESQIASILQVTRSGDRLAACGTADRPAVAECRLSLCVRTSFGGAKGDTISLRNNQCP